MNLDIRKYYDEQHGLLKNNPLIGMEAQHASQQLTGLYFTACAIGAVEPDHEIIGKLIERYKGFWNELKFIPRTISYVMTEDMKKEAKGDVWKFEEDLVFYSNPDVRGYWINTAVSHSQLMFLIMGLWFNHHPESTERYFGRDILEKVIQDGWSIKYQGNTVPSGYFAPFGVQAIKRCCIGRILGVNPGWLSKLWLSTVGMWGDGLDDNDRLNCCYWLWFLAKLGQERDFKAWFPKHKGKLIETARTDFNNTNDGDRLKDTLNLRILEEM